MPAAFRLSLWVALLLAFRPAEAAAPLEFRLTYDRAVADSPFTGRVYVLLSASSTREPRAGINWFAPEPFLALDVKDWKPGTPLVMGADALAYPTPLAQLKKGTYYVQAVLDLDRGGRHFGTSPGNGYSKAVRLDLDPATSGPVELVIDQVAGVAPFGETARVKLVDIESRLLTAFHGKPVRMRAGVVLPRSFGDGNRKYPVIYEVPGFSGRHTSAHTRLAQNATDAGGVEFLHVVLDPECRTGHHVFADSANNGPWGRALVEELIPHIEAKYRGLAPAGRFVTGHSSGGWSSLWLQVTYPDFFGGCWSTAPDPVDFRDFQRVNLYRPGVNLFTDSDGNPRPIARRGDRPALWYKGFSDMEVVMGRGGQLASFEAVFSPRGTDGRPRRLWDRKTGAVDPEVARAWEKYDIRLVLERNWKTLAPRLGGKLHVYTGARDNFYLEGAAALLKESLGKLGSDGVVEIIPGRDHSTLMDNAMRERIAREMAEQFRRSKERAY